MNESEAETKESDAPTEPLDYRRIEVVEPDIAAVLRSKSVAQRVAMTLDANQTARLLIAGRLKSEQPQMDPTSVKIEVARRMLNASLHSS